VALVGSAQSLGGSAFCGELAVKMHEKSFLERFRSKPENAAKVAAEAGVRSKARVNRSKLYYVKLHIAHLIQLKEMNDPVAFMLFGILLGESFACRGKPFELPASDLMQIPGLWNVKRLRSRLRKLEQNGLISIVARAPRPMLIEVPLSL
jgi:hypothetical protein